MPLWEVYHPENIFTDDSEREGLAQAITKLYTDVGIPAFYVSVIFKKMPEYTVYRSGKAQTLSSAPFVRIVWTNIAGTFEREEQKSQWNDGIEAAIKPFVADKGYDWEHHGIDSDVALGRIHGFDFPPRNSPLEVLWRETNKAVPLH